MQIFYKIKIIIFSIACICSIQPANSQQNTSEIFIADSLFKKNELIKAEKIYLNILNKNEEINEAVLTKLAFISKRKNNWLDELKYLNSLNHLNSSPKISERLKEIGQQRGLKEYEIGLWDRIRWIYFQYFSIIALILFLPLIYSIIILFIKFKKGLFIPKNYFYYLGIYMLILALFFNIPDFFSYGIIKPDKAYLRDFDSSGASVKKTLTKGSKILIIRNEDTWLYCMNRGELGYILKDDIEKF
jgi:hypothetical protein